MAAFQGVGLFIQRFLDVVALALIVTPACPLLYDAGYLSIEGLWLCNVFKIVGTYISPWGLTLIFKGHPVRFEPAFGRSPVALEACWGTPELQPRFTRPYTPSFLFDRPRIAIA